MADPTIKVGIETDKTKFDKGIDGAIKKLDDLATKGESGGGKITGAFSKVSEKLKGFGIDTGKIGENFSSKLSGMGIDVSQLSTGLQGMTGLSAGAMGAIAGIGAAAVIVGQQIMVLANATAEFAGEVFDLSQLTGITITELQKMRYAADQMSVSFSTIQSSMMIMTRGLTANAETYAALGVEVKNTDGTFKAQDEIFQKTIEKLSTMEDKTGRNALAMKLFGRGAVELVPLMEEGGDAFDDFKGRAEKLGIVMSEKLVKAGEEFGDAMSTINQQNARMGDSFMEVLMPVLVEMSYIWQNITKDVKIFIDAMVKNLAPIIKFIADLIQGLLGVVSGVFDVIGGILTGDFELVWIGAQKIVLYAVKAIIDLVSLMANGVITTINGMITALNLAVTAFGGEKIQGLALVDFSKDLGLSGYLQKLEGAPKVAKPATRAVQDFSSAMDTLDKSADKAGKSVDSFWKTALLSAEAFRAKYGASKKMFEIEVEDAVGNMVKVYVTEAEFLAKLDADMAKLDAKNAQESLKLTEKTEKKRTEIIKKEEKNAKNTSPAVQGPANSYQLYPDGFFTPIVDDAIKAFTQISTIASQSLGMIAKYADEAGQGVLNGLGSALPAVSKLIASGGTDIGSWLALWDSLSTMIFGGDAKAAQDFRETMAGIANVLIEMLQPVLEALAPIMTAFGEVFKTLMPILKPVFDLLAWGLNTIIKPIMDALKWVIDGIMIAINALAEFVKPVTDFFGGIGDFFGGIFSGIGSMLGFAGGTDFASGNPVLVGESGPEIITPPRGSSITPNYAIGSAQGNNSNVTVNINSPRQLNPSEAMDVTRGTMRRLAFEGVL